LTDKCTKDLSEVYSFCDWNLCIKWVNFTTNRRAS
jgi:hypothetical protein